MIRVRPADSTLPLYLPNDLSAMIRLRTQDQTLRLALVQTYLRERFAYRHLNGKEITIELVAVEKNPEGKFTQRTTPFWEGTL